MNAFSPSTWLLLALGVAGLAYAGHLAWDLYRRRDRRKALRRGRDRRSPETQQGPPDGVERRSGRERRLGRRRDEDR